MILSRFKSFPILKMASTLIATSVESCGLGKLLVQIHYQLQNHTRGKLIQVQLTNQCVAN